MKFGMRVYLNSQRKPSHILINKKCVQAKQPRNTFNLAEKKTNLLSLIHGDIFYSNNILTCGDKRYSKTFIDDFSRYYYVYLTNSKNKLFDKFKIFNAKFEI